MLELVDIWKQKEIAEMIEAINKSKEKINELKNKYPKFEYLYTSDYLKIPKFYRDFYYDTKGEINNKVTKLVNLHFQKLQAKIETKYGKILEIEATGNNGYDYRFKCENGYCNVEVIGAGGYNIQVYHTRWIIKK